MPFAHSTTFNVCRDNKVAARAFAARLKSEGFESEIIPQPPEAIAHARSQDQASDPASVAHNAPVDVAVAISIEIEEQHAPRERRYDDERPRSPALGNPSGRPENT